MRGDPLYDHSSDSEASDVESAAVRREDDRRRRISGNRERDEDHGIFGPTPGIPEGYSAWFIGLAYLFGVDLMNEAQDDADEERRNS